MIVLEEMILFIQDQRGFGPLTSLTPFSVQELGFGAVPRTKLK